MTKRHDTQLIGEIVGPVKVRDLWVTAIGSLALVVCMNVASVWYLREYPTNMGSWLVVRKWQMLHDLKEPVDWLILGDSSGNQGVMPALFDEMVGGRSVNLCTVASLSVANDVWLLHDYIKRFGAPRNVLLVHTYDVWTREPGVEGLAKIPLTWWDLLRLKPSLNLSLQEKVRLLLAKYAPLYAEPKALASLFQAPRTWFDCRFRLEANGFMAMADARPWYVESDCEAKIESLKKHEFRVSRLNREAISCIVSVAERYEFDVYLVNGPIYEGLYKSKEFLAYFDGLGATLEGVVMKGKRLHYILREPMTFPKELMQNTRHVVQAGAREYTRRLASEILQQQQLDRSKAYSYLGKLSRR